MEVLRIFHNSFHKNKDKKIVVQRIEILNPCTFEHKFQRSIPAHGPFAGDPEGRHLENILCGVTLSQRKVGKIILRQTKNESQSRHQSSTKLPLN